MASIDKIVQQYHENHKVEYVLMAVVDGEVIAKETDSTSADSLVGMAWVIDGAVENHIMQAAADEVEALEAAKTDDAIAAEREM